MGHSFSCNPFKSTRIPVLTDGFWGLHCITFHFSYNYDTFTTLPNAENMLCSTELLISAGISGTVFHRLVRSVEIDSHVAGLLLAFFLVNGLMIYVSISDSGNGIIRAISDALQLDVAFHTGLFGSMVLYRLFSHPLRNFPGPVGARISRLHASFLTLKTAQMHYVVQDMHRQYGDVVRTGILTSPKIL